MITPVALLIGAGSLFGGPSSPMALTASSPGDGIGPTATGRDPIKWPFSRDSIWNLPIGANARYVPGLVQVSSARGFFPDVNLLVLQPNAPLTDVYLNTDDWSGGSRCAVQGGVRFTAPIPTDFVVAGASPGDTPNAAVAILKADGRTLIQGQPFARCVAGQPPTINYWDQKEDLFGLGVSGYHGGSHLSSIGGTVRLGELVPGSVIRHSLKLGFLGGENYFYNATTRGFRWPALSADAPAASTYGIRDSARAALRMGSLLAIPPSLSIVSLSLETEPGRILARALQDYGGYVVDDAGWSVYDVSVEHSPDGYVGDEFLAAWGYPISPANKLNPWSRDMDKLMLALGVVDNWDQATWQRVSASNGAEGAGGGMPRVAWAPDFGADTVAPEATTTLSGTLGASGWYRSPVTVTLTATDAGSGVSTIRLRIDGGAWQLYSAPVIVSPDGSHTVDYYATDVAGNQGPIQTVAFKIDSVAPTATPTLSGTLGGSSWYRSPVTVTMTATDARSGVATIQLRTDGGAWAPYVSPETVSSDGSHTVDYYATDVAGNQAPIQTVAFQIDTGAPTAVAALSGTLGTAGWYRSPVTVMLTATSATGASTSIAYRLNGDPWVSYAGPFAVPEGRHVLEYRASDASGHVAPVSSVAIDVDYSVPTISRGTSGDAVIPLDGTLSWIGSDAPSGIVRYEVSIDGGPYQSLGTEASMTQTWTEGAHVAAVKAFDAAGNEATLTFPFRVDPTAEPQAGTAFPGPAQAIPFVGMAIGLALLGLGAMAGARRRKVLETGRSHASRRVRPARSPRAPGLESSSRAED